MGLVAAISADFCEPAMPNRPAKRATPNISLPPLPLDAAHLRAIYKAMRVSPRQASVIDLTLRDLSDAEIANYMGISISTVAIHRERIFARTGARTKMQIAMHVLAVSHQIMPADRSR